MFDTILCDKVCQWLATGRWFSLVLRFPPQIKLTATIYPGKWNIVESGIKHHKSKPNQTIVIIRSPWAKVDIKYCNQSSIVKICIISKYPPIPSRAILIQSWSEFILGGFYKSELQISCVFAFFTLWKRVKMHVLSDQSVHITHTYCCVSKLSKFGAYLYSRVHNNTFCLWEIPRNYFSKERAYTSEGYRMLAFLSIDVKRSDWMFMINHPIAVNITNKCGLRNK